MDNNIMNNELEQMRAQMNLLQEKLDKQEIINEQLLKRTINSSMSWIKRFVYLEFILIPVIALLGLIVRDMLNLSWWNCAFFIVLCICLVIIDYRINISSLRIDGKNDISIKDTMIKLIEMKTMRKKAFCISLLLPFIWLLWTVFELVTSTGGLLGDDIVRNGMIIGGIAGGCIGIVLGIVLELNLYRRMQRTNDSLIAQINDYFKEN